MTQIQNIDIITTTLDSCAYMISCLDKKRGRLHYKEAESNFFTDKDFVKNDYEKDFRCANNFIANKREKFRVFISAFDAYMSNPDIPSFEKDYIYGMVLESFSAQLCVMYKNDYDILTLDAYDEESGYDEEFDEDGYFRKPDLNSYFDYIERFPDRQELGIFYKYSYYINYISQTIADLLNKYKSYLDLDKLPNDFCIKTNIEPQKEKEVAEIISYDYHVEMLESISKVLRCENMPMRLALANDIIKWYENRDDLKEGVRLMYIHTILSDATQRAFYKAFFNAGLTSLRSESTISNLKINTPINTTSNAELHEIINRYKP